MCLIFTSITLQGDQNSEWKRHHKWFEKPFLWKFYETPSDRSSHGGFLYKKAVSEIWQNSPEKTCARVSFLINLQDKMSKLNVRLRIKEEKETKVLFFFVSPLSFHLWNPSIYLISKWHLNLWKSTVFLLNHWNVILWSFFKCKWFKIS